MKVNRVVDVAGYANPSQSSSAEKPVYLWRVPFAALNSASPPDFKKPILSLGIAQFSATINEHCSP